MPAEEASAAIVLRVRDYGESDRIATLLTLDFGKLGGIAKGAKSSRQRFERKLEPFSHAVVHFRRRPHGELVFITRAEAADLAQFRIEDDLGKIALGSYMLELADALTREQADAHGAYRLLADALQALTESGADPALRHAYELKMLEWAGFGAQFARCRICGNPVGTGAAAVYFIAARGGVVCERCRSPLAEGALKLAAKSAAALARLGALPIEDAPGADSGGADAARALARFIASVLDRRLRSADFLDSVLGGER
jgi:DNA repair protein RecO (recombination protein O)